MTEKVKANLSVLVSPLFDPKDQRFNLSLPEGLSVSEIVQAAFPGHTDLERRRFRVTLVNDQGGLIIEHDRWERVRPKAGATVVLRLIPAGENLAAVLQVVVSIAAIALGQYWAAPLLGGGTLGALGAAVVGLGVSRIGALQFDALSCNSPIGLDGKRGEN